MFRFALAAIFAVGFAGAALAQSAMKQDGQVLTVDRNGKSFSAQKNFGSATYVTTPRTAILIGATPTSFEAVKIGHKALVDYHMEGTTAVADHIVLQ